MQKPIFKRSKSYPICNYILLPGDGTAVQVSPGIDHWRITEADYYGPMQLIHRDTVSRALKSDKRPTIEHGRIVLNSGIGQPVHIPLEGTDGPDPGDYPTPPEFGPEAVNMAVPGFADAVRQVKYAMANEDVRYYLNGFCLDIQQGRPVVVATNGHRLHFQHLPAIAHDESLDGQYIFSHEAAPHIDSDLITVDRDGRAQVGNFITTLIAGKFPDWRRVVPRHDAQLTVNRKSLLDWLKAWKATRSDRDPLLLLEWGTTTLRAFSHSGTDRKELGLNLECSATQEGQLGLNARYFIEALRHASSETVCIEFRDANSAILIDSSAVVMPCRV